LGTPGALLAYWTWTAFHETADAQAWVLWAAERSPVRLTTAPIELARDLTSPGSLIFAGVLAAFLCIAALMNLRHIVAPPRRRLLDETHDGRARLELKSAALRVGCPVEGRLWLAREAQAGDVFNVSLRCHRSYRSGDRRRTEEVYYQDKDAKAVHDARGWSVPFRFDVPASAPSNTSVTTPQPLLGARREPYEWDLSIGPAGKMLARRSVIALYLGPASEEEVRALAAQETPEQKEALDAIGRILGPFEGALLPHQREQLKALSSEDLALARKASALTGKGILLVVVAFFAIFLVLPVVAVVLFVMLSG
jgi:hypothetical protein